MSTHRFEWLLAALLLAGGCASKAQAPKRELSERERDSLIGVSGLPGGIVVTRALSTSDWMAARAARQNDQTQHSGDESQGSPP